MVTADEVGRSLRGAAAFTSRRAEGLRDFGTSEEATPKLAKLFALTFGVVALQAKWFAAKAALAIGALPAAGLTGLGLALAAGLDAMGRLVV